MAVPHGCRGTAVRHCLGLAGPPGQRPASGTYEPAELLELAPAELPALPELPEPLPPMWVQWCVPVDPGMLPAGLVPVDVGEDGADDGDELGDAEDDVVDVVDAVPDDAEPPVDASATPVAPAPTPAATMPVMMSRRARPPILETIGFLPSWRPAASRRRRVVRDQRASRACQAPEARLSARYEPPRTTSLPACC